MTFQTKDVITIHEIFYVSRENRVHYSIVLEGAAKNDAC